ncbi:MAG: helix-turn-helix transcriptional regulator, partial [Pseudomonas sp.]
FTPAEWRLCELLLQGLAPKQCASELQVSITTVRTQLRALLRKTNTERQVELLNLLNGLSHF